MKPPRVGQFVSYFDRSEPLRAIPAVVTAVRAHGLTLTVFRPDTLDWLCQVNHKSAASSQAGFWDYTQDIVVESRANH